MYESQIMESIYQEKKQYIPLFMIRPPPAYFTLIDPITFFERICLQDKRRNRMNSMPDRQLFETLKNLITGQRLGVLVEKSDFNEL